MQYLLHITTLAGIYATLAVSLDLLVGRAGILSLSHAAFSGLGAYAAALLALHVTASLPLGILLAMAVGVLGSLVVSVCSVRLHEDYFVLASLAFQAVIFSLLNNWTDLTRGPLGIGGIPRPTLCGWSIRSTVAFAGLSVTLAASAFLIVARLARSPLGRVLSAIREDDVLAQSLGKNVPRTKVLVFAVSAALAAAAGSVYAYYVTYVDPGHFTVAESVLMLSMVVIGGAGSYWGPLVGAILLVTLPEALRFVGLPNAMAASIREVIYGTSLLAMMLARPRGLAGHFGFGR